MKRLAAGAVVLALVVGGAVAWTRLSSSSESPAVATDRRPRVPDVEGVIKAVTPERVVLDGGRTLALAPDVVSFSTYTMQAVRPRPGTYVQLGLGHNRRVTWMATIGIVAATDPPRVRYTGVLARLDDGRALFEDGTVLRTGTDVRRLLRRPGFVVAELDPASGEVVGVS